MRKRKVLALFAFLLVTISIVGCGGISVQEDLLNYINEDLPKLDSVEIEVAKAREGLNQLKVNDDKGLANLLESQVEPMVKKMARQVRLIKPKTKEVKNLHKMYISSLEGQHSAILLMIPSIRKGDDSKISKVDEKLDLAEEELLNYMKKLEKLATENNIEYEPGQNKRNLF